MTDQNEEGDDEDEEYKEESEVPKYVAEEFRQFEISINQILEETKTVNLGDQEYVNEVKISVHLNKAQRKNLIYLLTEYIDMVVGEVSDMLGLSTNVVSHKLQINTWFSLVKLRDRKFKPYLSLMIMEDITKQIESRLVDVMQYPSWLANVVPVAKKYAKIRIFVNYRDLKKMSPKDNFPLPNIYILIDNSANHELQSYVACYASNHQILMDE
ncbi:uncharacterized protein [Solanum lycopersicum]|uniref:uncharacterized protein n=1 Tax=Solanum lycopersicum TaxID=4081 RepID=UPI000532D202